MSKDIKSKLRLEWREASKLEPNPLNWRRHPQFQKKALENAMASVGWAGALLYNERTSRLLDGHLRKEVAEGDLVPVLVGDWSEEQEKIILASLDPISTLAVPDSLAFADLTKDLAGIGEDLDKLINSMREEISFAELEEGKGGIGLNKQGQVIKVAIFLKDILLFEQALLATGERSREIALIQICRRYLGQS